MDRFCDAERYLSLKTSASADLHQPFLYHATPVTRTCLGQQLNIVIALIEKPSLQIPKTLLDLLLVCTVPTLSLYGYALQLYTKEQSESKPLC